MPYEIRKLPRYLLLTMSGVVTPGDLSRLGDEVDGIEDSLPAPMNRISDLTSVEKFAVGFTAVSALAARRRQRVFSRPVRSALIVREPEQVGVARMFQTLMDNPMIEVRILRSIEEAEAWFEDVGPGS